MLILDTTTAILRIVTSAVCDVQVQVSYTDDLVETVGPPRVDVFQTESQPTLITTATTTTICASPAASSTRRNIRGVNIRNAHATTAVTITVEIYDGTTAVKLPTVTLLAGEYGIINEAGVPFWYDANGSVKAGTGPGRLLRSTILTSGTSHTTGPLTTSMMVKVQAAGGGGSGCTSVASAAAAGGGGSGGGYAERLFTVVPSTAYAYTIGALGAGVSGAAGANGGNSTFVVGGTTVTAFGGPGAVVATAAITLTARAGGIGSVVSTNGDVNSGGTAGVCGVVLIVAGPIGASGKGGDSVYGAGGPGITAVGNGVNGTGYGAGGGGSLTGASAVRTGGNGTGGVIVVEEYS